MLSEQDYDHAQTVWRDFQIENMGQYHDLYLKTDVILLADVFENFRKVCHHYYKLDPAHYYTSPGLAWSANSTGVELELLTDYDQHLFIEKGILGGIAMIAQKYAVICMGPQWKGIYQNQTFAGYLKMRLET